MSMSNVSIAAETASRYLRQPQPGWMAPLVADLAAPDLADAELQGALQLPTRNAALGGALGAVAERIEALPVTDPRRPFLLAQARQARQIEFRHP